MAVPEFLSVSTSTFALISLAEIGDKSQLVCMTLAARHRAWPVLLGSAIAFLMLNSLAVLFGAGVATWIPEQILAIIVALLFSAFGIHALRSQAEDDDEEIIERPGHGIFLTTLMLILVAEFGDKTQLAVAGLAVGMPVFPVWLGASVALIFVSALGVWAGRSILQKLPVHWLHRLSGGMFLLFAGFAAWQAFA